MTKYSRDNLEQLHELFLAEIGDLKVDHYGGTMIFYAPSGNAHETSSQSAVSERVVESDLPCLLI